MYLGMYYWNKQ